MHICVHAPVVLMMCVYQYVFTAVPVWAAMAGIQPLLQQRSLMLQLLLPGEQQLRGGGGGVAYRI